jgi:DNA ligase-1
LKFPAVEYRQAVFLPSAGLWLDPRWPKAFAFVSHAHSDHTARHEHTLCTPATARLMQARMGGGLGRLETHEYGERTTFRNCAATLLPAGHVLGSAQLLFESAEGSVLYTGDFKLRRRLSCEPATARSADTLIMETTFGLPRYQFPPAEQVAAQVVKFCHEALEDGDTPVLLGYALGKAQEILSVLAGAGLPIMLHGTIEKIARIYEEFGVVFPLFEKYDAARVAGHVLVCPPSVNGSRMLSALKNRRVAVLTGWAMDPGAVYRQQVDAAFPLSDHADYNDLLRYVELVSPRRVLTLHGFAQEFARDLRARGIEAWSLTGPDQLELAIAPGAPAATTPAVPETPLENRGFNALALVGEAVRATTGKLEKIRLLSAYLGSLDDADLARAAVWLSGRAFPQADDRPLNVGGSVITKALRSASGLNDAELTAIRRRHNDSGLTAAEAMAARPGTNTLSLEKVEEALERLRTARGPTVKIELLSALFAELPALASGYLVRILTGDLRIGLKEGLLEDAVAAACGVEADHLREANMLLGDIGRAAVLARHGRLAEAGLTLFQPLKCMLASPEPDADALWQRLGTTGSVWLEDKLDGIRAQIHCSPERAEIYSRDLKRVTATFPEIAAAARGLGRDAVLDGEILAWENGRALSFFELQKRLGRREADLFLGEQIPVACVVFDILRLDGESLLKRPLSERRQCLESIPWTTPFQPAAVLAASTPAEVETAFGLARARGNEGLMAKDPDSLYTPGRRGLAWIKLKKEFATLDVVVVAAEYGHGRRSKVLSDYTFAVRDEATGALLPIGKAYSGLTDAEIDELTAEFLELARDRKGNRYEVEPRVVLEVAFDSIQPSNRHASGLALRFPRIKAIRRDKTPADIDTLAAARRLAGLEPELL